MSESCWKLDGTVARLAIGGASAKIDLTRPKNGLALKIPGAPSNAAWHILGVDFEDAQPTEGARLDAYVRGDDLVATFEESAPRRVRAQIYWRCLKPGDFSPEYARHIAAAFDLIVSVNTSLLDSDPQSSVRSIVLSADKLLGIAGDGSRIAELSPVDLQGSPAAGNLHGFIVRPTEGNVSYAEIVHPAESCRSEAKWANQRETNRWPAVEITQHLFQQRLEKGVILRGWIRSALVAREHDQAAVLAAYQHFIAAEPPLTV